MIVYYIIRHKREDLHTRRWPLWEELKGYYNTDEEAEAAADVERAKHPDYVYCVEVGIRPY